MSRGDQEAALRLMIYTARPDLEVPNGGADRGTLS